MMSEATLIGKRLPREGSVDKALGRAKYTGDMVLPNMLYGKILRSPHAHARILSIDTSRAEKLPGVKAVVTGRTDTPLGPDGQPGKFGIVPATIDHVLLPIDRVRYMGEEVAAVAAVDEDTAEEAIGLIRVEYEVLPHVLTAEDAMKDGAPLIHEGKPKNIAAHYLIDEGDVEKGFAKSDLILEDTFTCDVQSHALPEPFATLVDYEPSGKFNIWNQTQCPFQNRQGLSNTLMVPLSDIRVHSGPMGGAHGGRSDTHPATFIACLLSRKAARPVLIKMSREEVEDAMRDKAAKSWTVKIGFKKDGTILARDITMLLEAGAYGSSAIVELWVPLLIDEVLWRAPSYRFNADLAYTNKTVSSMMRTRAHIGPMAAEILFDRAAEALGLDPLEIRLKNAVLPGEVVPSKSTVTSSGLSESIKMAADKAGWKEKRGRMASSDRIARGIGVGSGNMQSMFYMGFRTGSTAFIKFNDDGSCTLFTGNNDLGQGNLTMFKQVASEELGIPMEDVKVCYGDTELCYQDPGNYSMSATIISGNAVKKAARHAKGQLLEIAAELLDVSPEEVDFKDKKFLVRYRLGKGKPVSLRAVCRTAFKRGRPIHGFGDHRGRIDFSDFNVDSPLPYNERVYGQKVSAYSFGSTTAEVEVDRQTGKVKVTKIVAVNDCGTVLNPLLVEGNMHGQINFMLGHGLYEYNVWDPGTGKKLTSSYRTYKVPTVNETPEIEIHFLEIPDPEGPYGAKEGSLAFGCGLHGAIACAVYDA
ncbi:MAG: xanthine dehydrogenase family protein molybdopterin-binding subunit, partial [Pseudomonadota bacterium]